MRLQKRKHATIALMDLTPMIDVVFLLLIFFIAFITQREMKRYVDVEVPEKIKQLPERQRDEPTMITINIDRQGEIIIDDRTMSLGDFISYINRELAAVGDQPGRLKIELRADKRGTSRTVNRVISTLTDLGINQINIAVELRRD